MDAGPLDVFHDAGNQHVLSVGDDVHLQFDAGQVLVHQDGVFNAAGEDLLHIGDGLFPAAGDGHVLPADHVGRTQQHGVAQLLGGVYRFLKGAHAHAPGTADAELFEQGVEASPVLGHVDAFGAGAQDADALPVQELGQLDGRLSAEGHHDADGLLDPDDVHHVLRVQGLKIQAVGGVVVGGNGFRVVVDDDHVVAHFPEGPDGMDGAVVKFDALADADRAGAQHHDDGLAGPGMGPGLAGLVHAGIEVGRHGGKFRPAGVNHLVAHGMAGQVGPAGEGGQGVVRIAKALAPFVLLVGKAVPADVFFKIHQVLDLAQEPAVDLCDLKDGVDRHTLFQGFKDGKDPPVVLLGKPGQDVLVRQGLGV